MQVRFVASVSPIVDDLARARDFYADVIGIGFEGGDEDYAYTERLDGVKHLGLWPLSAVAEAGQRLLHGPRREPWGQTVARLLSEEGLVVAVCTTPHLRAGRHLDPRIP